MLDGGKQRIILGVLVVPGEVMDNQPILDLLWRVSFRWRVRCKQATGDAAYGTVEIIKALEDAHIRAYIPVAEKGQRTGYYGLAQFTYDAIHDQYRCPASGTCCCLSIAKSKHKWWNTVRLREPAMPAR